MPFTTTPKTSTLSTTPLQNGSPNALPHIKNVVFCVNGSGYDDASVAALKKRNDVGTEFIPGVSNVSAALSLYPCSRFACASASEISLLKTVDTDIPLIITEVYDKDTASEVKLALFAFYKDDHPCFLVDKNGARKLPLHETDLNGVFSYDTALLLPPLPLTEKKTLYLFRSPDYPARPERRQRLRMG